MKRTRLNPSPPEWVLTDGDLDVLSDESREVVAALQPVAIRSLARDLKTARAYIADMTQFVDAGCRAYSLAITSDHTGNPWLEWVYDPETDREFADDVELLLWILGKR